MWKPIIVAATIAGLGACSPTQDIAAATPQITTFHQQLDAENYDAIFQNADPLLKSGTPESTLVQFLTAVHRKLGPFKSGSSAGWNDNIATQGHFLTITYAAKYERGDATETFVYRVDSNPAKLVAYHINSNALIVN